MILLENDNYLPKYVMVKNKIKNMIEDKDISPGEKIPSESQLREEYKVSRHTIRKAIDLLVTEGILEKRQGIGTFYCGKNGNRTGNIGFISISLHDYIFADILSAADDLLHQEGYQIILGNSQDDLKREKNILLQFLEKDIDGLIIEPAQSASSSSNLSILEEFAKRNIPVLVLDSKYSFELLNTVLVDDEKGGYIATKHLIEKGHKKIAMIYKSAHNPALARLEGYKRAMREADIPLDEALIRPYNNSEFSNPLEFEAEIKAIIHDLLEVESLSAFFAFNDQIAVLVKEILNELGLTVPNDISIIGFDDSKMVALNNISISSIAHPKEKAGKKAAEIIIDQIEGAGLKASINKMFRPLLIERGSVRDLK